MHIWSIVMAILALSPLILAASGDITAAVNGVVNHSSVKKYPTIVYIEEIPGRQFASPEKHAAMDQKGKVFLPHVLPILVGTTVDFLNSDAFDHNVFSPDGESYDLGKWGQGEKRSHTFSKPGVYTQLCKVHPEMVGYILVLKTPHFALADKEGRFRIPEVPVGTWTLKVWNERLRPGQLKKSFSIAVSAGREASLEITF